MGIRGLFSYMNKNPQFLNSHQLHDTHLVIDGANLASWIYQQIKYTCAWGGDYDKYARLVDEFFNDLSKCEVTPIVIGRGSVRIKIVDHRLRKMNEKMNALDNYNPRSEEYIRPLALYSVFYSILKQKGVKVYQSFFKAEATAAVIAKSLDCPVLSGDSDFFILDVKLIVLNSLNPYIEKNAEGLFFKQCKIFKPENLWKEFPGLDSTNLPLLVPLINPDYAETDIFKYFFLNLKLERTAINVRYTDRKINATLKWLSSYDLSSAVEAVLGTLPKAQHGEVIDIIEEAVNKYIDLPCNVINEIALENKKVCKLNSMKPFIFQGSADRGEKIQKDKKSRMEFIDTLPTWFCEEYNMSDLTKFFVNMMSQRICLPSHMEDMNYPSIKNLKIEIIKVLDGLLVAHSKKPVANLQVYIRNKPTFDVHDIGEPITGTKSTVFPALQQLRDTDIEFRKLIIDDTLEVTELGNIFEDVPQQWKLYLMTIHFWAQKTTKLEFNATESHLLALVTCMLFNLIDEKIGYHRFLINFKKDYQATLDQIATRNTDRSTLCNIEPSDRLEEVLKTVTIEDCLLIAPFFISNFSSNEHFDNATNFDIKVVHSFTQFLSVCNYVLHLNALLGRPYDDFLLAKLFNGTLLYNLYMKFENESSAFIFVDQIFERSPSLKKILKMLFMKILPADVSYPGYTSFIVNCGDEPEIS